MFQCASLYCQCLAGYNHIGYILQLPINKDNITIYKGVINEIIPIILIYWGQVGFKSYSL
jgi:hypothetical protein